MAVQYLHVFSSPRFDVLSNYLHVFSSPRFDVLSNYLHVFGSPRFDVLPNVSMYAAGRAKMNYALKQATINRILDRF